MAELTASALLDAFMNTPYSAGQCDNILSDYAEEKMTDEDGPELVDLHRNRVAQKKNTKTGSEPEEDWSAYDDDIRNADKEVSMLLPGGLSSTIKQDKIIPKNSTRWWRQRKAENILNDYTLKKKEPCNISIFDDGIEALPNQLFLINTPTTPRSSKATNKEVESDGTPVCSVTNALRTASSPRITSADDQENEKSKTPQRILSLVIDEDNEEQLGEVHLKVYLVDNTFVTVKARTEDRAHSVLSAAALRLGLAAEHLSILALYAVGVDNTPEHRFVPGTPVAALRWLVTKKTSHKLVLAARLLTPRLLKVAAQGFRREAPATELALAKLLYAQAVASVMTNDPSRLPPLFPDKATEKNSSEDDEDFARVDEFLRLRRDCPERSDGLASALRLGALRLWARAVDAIALEPGLSLISAAVRLVQEYGAAPFVPKHQTPENWHWETQLLEELDFLLKILQSQRLRHQRASNSFFSQADAGGEGITIEVFDTSSPPVSPGGTRRERQVHTILQVEPSTPIKSPRHATHEDTFLLLPAACLLRLVSSYESFGSARFSCAARRRASSSSEIDAEPSSPVSANGLFPAKVDTDANSSGYTANRTLSISASGIAIYGGTSTSPLLTVPLAKLRRWVCDAQENTVRFEAEEPFDPFDEECSSPKEANRLLNGLSTGSASKATHLKANERFANRTRRKLRKSIRVAASLPPPRTPRQQRAAAREGKEVQSERKEAAIESTLPASPQDGGFGTWARSFFSPSPVAKEVSIGQKIHQVLGDDPENEEEEEDGDDITGGLIDKDDESRLLKRVIYQVKLVAAATFANQSQTTEIISLLDDYFALDLAEYRPRCKYESVFASSSAKSTDSPSKTGSKTFPKKVDPDAVLGGRPTVYKALVSAVVRPPRFKYDTRLLGPSSFDFAGRRIFRHDLVLRNKDGRRIHCSHWKPVGPACGADGVKHRALNFGSPRTGPQSPQSPQCGNDFSKTPCVVFMHANSASRVQATAYLSVVLSLGYSMFAFDCGGSGVSDGDFVSLGFHEAYDLLVVIAHLRSLTHVGNIAVWGHSMGAAAVIYYQAFSKGKWPRLDACVLDSPYSDFRILANHLVSSNAMLSTSNGSTQNMTQYLTSFSLFNTALQLVLDSIDSSVQTLVGVSPLADLSPVSNAHLCSAPALFLQARNDKIISMAHVEELANMYGGPRKLAIIDGTHSSPRNGAARKFVALYLKKHIKLPQDQRYPNSRVKDAYLDGLPWQSASTSTKSFGQ